MYYAHIRMKREKVSKNEKNLEEIHLELTTLFSMQKQLDQYIQSNGDNRTNVFEEKGLALIVELAEMANETRCFKFWSTKGSSSKEVILEEYVDSIHFLLSLGIEKGYDTLSDWPTQTMDGTLTQLFLQTTNAIQQFLQTLTFETYASIWVHYGAIAERLGFTNEEIMSAYIDKNEENYVRQQTGY